MKRMRIAVLAGGWSGEREVSLKSGRAVFNALDEEKYDRIMIDPAEGLGALIEQRHRIDLAFAVLHGRFGEDGCIQGLLQMLRIPFVGSGVLSSAMALNKKVTKGVYRHAGLEVAKDVVLRRGEDYSVDRIMERLGPQTIVKPVSEGSSLGMSLCSTALELTAGIDKAFGHDREVMVEEYIKGREVTCCVLGARKLSTLPLVEIVPKPLYRFFDYEAKYTPGGTDEICPAPIPGPLAEAVCATAKKAHAALSCKVWSRTDMIVRGDQIYLLETNTVPGMTENSLFPLAARAAGMSLSALLDKLIEFSLEEA